MFVDEIMEQALSINKSIIEMDGEDARYHIDTSPSINIEDITKDDENPMFVNIEIIRTCVSKNNRRYLASFVSEIAEALPKTMGYLGHANPDGVGWQFREPQGVYVGSKIITEGTDIVCLGKCYIFPTSELRTWIPSSISLGKPITVSISADAIGIRNGDIFEIHSLSDLKSVDFCNNGTEGIPTSKIYLVTNEMEGEMEEMDRNEVIQTLTLEEIQSSPAYVAPDYSAYETQISELNETITTNATTIEELNGSIAEKDGKIAELESKIAEMESAEIESYKALKIAEQVDEDKRELFSKHVTGNTKEEIDASIAEQLEFINAFHTNEMNNKPAPRERQEELDTLKERIKNTFANKR